jgi:dCTP deaminase
VILNDGALAAGLRWVEPLLYVPDERIPYYGPITEAQIQPASIDVRLAEEFKEIDGEPFYMITRGGHIEPGECLLGSLVERVNVPANMVARIEGKSSWARRFLTVHSAGYIDPGFHGDITLELKNDSPKSIPLQPGVLIAQVSFSLLTEDALRPYGSPGLGSHYQNQKGPTCAA